MTGGLDGHEHPVIGGDHLSARLELAVDAVLSRPEIIPHRGPDDEPLVHEKRDHRHVRRARDGRDRRSWIHPLDVRHEVRDELVADVLPLVIRMDCQRRQVDMVGFEMLALQHADHDAVDLAHGELAALEACLEFARVRRLAVELAGRERQPVEKPQGLDVRCDSFPQFPAHSRSL